MDGVQSTTHVPLADIIAFIPVMNETIKPYLTAKGNSAGDVEKMHRAWFNIYHNPRYTLDRSLRQADTGRMVT